MMEKEIDFKKKDIIISKDGLLQVVYTGEVSNINLKDLGKHLSFFPDNTIIQKADNHSSLSEFVLVLKFPFKHGSVNDFVDSISILDCVSYLKRMPSKEIYNRIWFDETVQPKK